MKLAQDKLSLLSGCDADRVRGSSDIRETVLRLARIDPRLACMILKGMAQFQPQTYLLRAQSASGAAGDIFRGSFNAPVSADFYVQDVNYQIRSFPDAFAGSPQEYWIANQYALNPRIEASLTCKGSYLPWLFSNSFAPIESLCRYIHAPPGSRCCEEFVLVFPQEVSGQFIPKIALPDPKCEIIIAFEGLTLGFQNFGGIDLGTAQRALATEYGVGVTEYNVQAAFRKLAGTDGQGTGVGGIVPDMSMKPVPVRKS